MKSRESSERAKRIAAFRAEAGRLRRFVLAPPGNRNDGLLLCEASAAGREIVVENGGWTVEIVDVVDGKPVCDCKERPRDDGPLVMEMHVLPPKMGYGDYNAVLERWRRSVGASEPEIFVVAFEDVAFGCEPGESKEMSADELAPLFENFPGRGKLPARIKGIEKASFSVDDSVYRDGRDPDGEVKCFVRVELRVEAWHPTEIEKMDAPERFLNAIAENLGGGRLALEGNWENVEVGPSSEAAPALPAPAIG